MIVIADASPLVALGRVGRLDLLQTIFGELAIPDAVWHEVVEADPAKPGSKEIATATWIRKLQVRDLGLVSLLRHDLGAGEAEAIVLARETSADFLLMDERLGRSAAQRLGLKAVGLVGVLVEARERGLLLDPENLVDQLHLEAGFWISADLRKLITGVD
jgi:predicted nucleic acid-binding protein